MGKKVNRDFFTRFLSLLVSIGLWLYVAYAENPQQEVWLKSLPVKYVNSETLDANSLTVVSGQVNLVSVKVSGRRKDIARLKQSTLTTQVDLSSVTAEGSYRLPVTVSIPVEGITVTDKRPYNAEITVEAVVTKELPVRVETDGNPAEDFALSGITTSPEMVRIRGARSAVSEIGGAVVNVDVKGIVAAKSEQCTVQLVKNDGSAYKGENVRLLDATIKVDASVAKTKFVPIKADITAADGAEIQSVQLNSTEAEIKLDGAIEADVSELHTKPVTVVYSDKPVTVTLQLDIPEGVKSNITSVNAVVTFKEDVQTGADEEENETG